MTGAMDMYFMDVGQGDSTYIEVGEAGAAAFGNFLIDFGFKERQFNGDNPPEQTLEMLVDLISKASRARGRPGPELTRLFITHPDSDHWNMLAALVVGASGDTENLWVKIGKWSVGAKLKLNALVYGGDEADYQKDSKKRAAWEVIKGAVNSTDITVLGNQDHDAQALNGGVTPRWTYLNGALKIFLINSNYPQKGGTGAPNPKSLCLIFQYDNFKLMLMGDAEPTTVGERLTGWYPHNNNAFLRCDALKLAHHGSRNGTPDWWAKLVKPNYGFVSGDYYWSHPYYEAIKNTLDANSIKENFMKHWMASSKDDEKDYVSESTAKAMFPNLWYVVTTSAKQTAKNQKGIVKSYPPGMYVGVAWLLSRKVGGAVSIHYSPEDVWPGINEVPT